MAETELNQSIEDVSKDKWLTVTTMIDSTWSYSLKAPNTNLSSRVKSVRGIEDLFVRLLVAPLITSPNTIVAEAEAQIICYEAFA